MTDDLSTVPVAARVQAVSSPGPLSALADDRSGSSSARDGWAPAAAGEIERVLTETHRRWRFVPYGKVVGGFVPVPRDGWLECGFCGSDKVVVRSWQFHQRPGKPTVPYRCDVHAKCGACAAGWWHGVALGLSDWLARPPATGIRSWLMGRYREPMLWASDRGGRRG